jgi:integrase
METIKNKSGIRYRDMIWINGKAIKSPVFPRKSDCKQWKAEQKAKKVELILYGDKIKLLEKMSLAQYSQKWLKSKEAQGVARASYRNYETFLRVHILPFFGDKELRQIQKADVEEFVIHLRKDHNPKGTNIILTMLKSMFKSAIDDGYLIKSPCELIKKITEDSQSDIYWTKSEIDQFLKANYRHKYYNLFLVALNTGMRRGELAGLCWDRIDFNSNIITVTRTRDDKEHKERTKTTIIRVVPMTNLVRATLLSLFKSRGGSEFVFLEPDGSPIRVHHIYRVFSRAQKNAGVGRNITFHDLRHTFASQFVMDGGSIYDLQKILGHTCITMTQRYAHLSLDHLHAAMKDFELGGRFESVTGYNEEKESNEVIPLRDKLIRSCL